MSWNPQYAPQRQVITPTMGYQVPDVNQQVAPMDLNFNTGATNSGFQLGWNAPTMQMGMQGLNTLGNLWGAWQSNKLAKDQLNFTKMMANANLNNQIKSYNTGLEDRSRSRAAVEGQSSAEAQAYVDRNRLSR